MKTVAVVVAAGKGERMGASIGKQFVLLSGRPILAHTLDIFDKAHVIDEIVLVLSRDDQTYFKENVLTGLTLNTPLTTVAGGASRQASVYNGLARISADTDVVAIHDGVRPLVTNRLIDETVNTAKKNGAAIPSLPVTDTIKRINRKGVIEKTIARSKLHTAQTPQAFQLSVIKKAHIQARENGYAGTDDAQLVEEVGLPVAVVQGSPDNIKITTPRDLFLAEAIIENRKIAG